jgi:transcriptional regulator with XRE-family HTH domain
MATIEALRTARGITQTELGKAVHTSAATVSQWERGRRIPGKCRIEELAEFFGVAESEIELPTPEAATPRVKKNPESSANPVDATGETL